MATGTTSEETHEGTKGGQPAEPGPAERAAARRRRGHVASYGDDRVCEAEGCDTKLSRYNTKPVCWTHDEASSATE
ncbi:MAG TPA: hypothetical protein VGZ52_09375 [Acidimicrobiales bacterium]|jgi:hypothetical protein|nr:hypothetical protein [Acidimicrobiales bacterium]